MIDRVKWQRGNSIFVTGGSGKEIQCNDKTLFITIRESNFCHTECSMYTSVIRQNIT